MNGTRKSLTNTTTNNEKPSFIRTSDSTASIATTTTTNYSSFEDYFSKIDQQIRTSKNSLQSYNIPTQYSKYLTIDLFYFYLIIIIIGILFLHI